MGERGTMNRRQFFKRTAQAAALAVVAPAVVAEAMQAAPVAAEAHPLMTGFVGYWEPLPIGCIDPGAIVTTNMGINPFYEFRNCNHVNANDIVLVDWHNDDYTIRTRG